MLTLRETAEFSGAQKVPCRLKPKGEASPWNPPMWIPGPDEELNKFGWVTPVQWDTYSKILSDDSPNPNRYWKPCQHYKRRWLKSLGLGLTASFHPVMQSATGYGMYYVQDRRRDREVSENHRYDPLFEKDGKTVRNQFTESPPAPALMAYANTANYAAWGPPGNHINGYQALMSAQPNGGFAAPPDDLSSLIQHSLSAMLPSIKSEVSLINTIIELKDFKSLPKTFARMRDFTSHVGRRISFARTGREYYDRVRRSFGNGLGPTLREATSTGADGYLQSEFNIRPLLSDICSVWNGLLGAQKKINNLLAGQGRRHVKHFTRKFDLLTPEIAAEQLRSSYTLNDPSFGTFHPVSYPSIGTQFDGYYSPRPDLTGLDKAIKQNYEARRTISSYTGVFHAQIEYSYTFTRFQEKYASILGYLDYFGVNLNLAIIWNAIPWSFVVDWVFGVSRFLDQFKVLALLPDTRIHQYSWSWKVARVTRLTVKGVACPLNDELMPRVELPPILETLYRRDVGIPTESPLIAGGLSLKELTLGAALLVPRKWRPHRVSSPRKPEKKA
jgi:hypothetical protein